MRRTRLQTQILLFFLICITVVFAIQLAVIHLQVGGMQMRQSESVNEQLVQSKAGEIGAWFNQRLCEIRIASQHSGFQTMDPQVLLPYLDSLNAAISGVYGGLEQPFVISDTLGTIFLPGGQTLDISQREYFQQAFASNKEYTVSKPLYSQLEWQRVVMISYAIRNAAGEKIGYVHGSLLLSRIDEVLSQLSLYDGMVFILDNEGRVLAESQNHLHGEKQAACPQSYRFSASVQDIFAQESGWYSMPMQTGEEGLLFHSSIPCSQGWKLCVLISRSAIEAPMSQMTQLLLLVWVGLVLMLALLSPIYIRAVVRPLNRLADAMDAVNLDDPAPHYEGSGSQEIRRLSTSFNRMTARIQQLLARVLEEQKLKRDAEFRALQAQINPHFLYNTLDTIAWKSLSYGAEEVADMVSALSQFFRLSLNRGQDFISLDAEMDHVYSYLYIQKIRYEEKLEFSLDLDEQVRNVSVPKLIIQPLVENALYHGIKSKEGIGHIQVRIRPRGGDMVSIVVADDGAGMDTARLLLLQESLRSGQCSAGFGLCNIAQRLRLAYGPAHRLTIRSVSGRGTVVRILLPQERSSYHVSADHRR